MTSTKKKTIIDIVFKYFFLFFTILSSSVILVVTGVIIYKGLSPFFKTYSVADENIKLNFFKFLFNSNWSYPEYGIFGILLNTIWITLLATLIALPISVLTAMYIVRMANKKVGAFITYTIELLAAIPSVIFGLFAKGVLTKITGFIANMFFLESRGGLGTLTSALVLAMMMIPTITMLSITSMKAVKKSQIEGSLALGATMMQTNFKIVIKGAKEGIITATILGVGRALGEATAVSMVAGNSVFGPNIGLFEITRTLTTTMMLGLHETFGLDYDIRFTSGLFLIIVILIFTISLNILKRKMEKR